MTQATAPDRPQQQPQLPAPGADSKAWPTAAQRLSREWARYTAGFTPESRSELNVPSLLTIAVFGGFTIAAMTFIPAVHEFTGFDRPWLACGLLAGALCASFLADCWWTRTRVRNLLLLVDSMGYCSVVALLMVHTSSPTRYAFGIMFGQMASDYGRRLPFSVPMLLAIGLVPLLITLGAWPDFGLLTLVLFGVMMFAYTSLTTENHHKLRRQHERLKSVFAIADRVATNSVEVAVANSTAEIGGFVHHLRNSLTPVVNHLKLLARSESLGEDERHSVEAARRGAARSIEHLEKLVATLKSRPAVTSFSLDVVLRRSVANLRELIPGSSIDLSAELPEFEVVGNPDQLQLVIENLVHNAVEASARAVTLRMQLEPDNQRVTLTIADDAAGVPASIQESLFDKPVPSGKPQGHGVGLYFSRRLVELSGGRLTLRSTGAKGSAFEISLPGHLRSARVG